MSKIGADGAVLSADATDHQAIAVLRDLLAHPIYVANASPPSPVTWKEARAWAEGLTINGWAWRLATVEEAFLVCDHNRKGCVLDPQYFSKVEIGWAWTSTEDPDTAGYARDVFLDFGGSNWFRQDDRGRALAVRASQSV
ncbi:MAG: DUF1566 domain-containing protein [Patescibacteria group bacterium]|nr:DUF1566 domain-containing protein [Patescibacteria group bacterium]